MGEHVRQEDHAKLLLFEIYEVFLYFDYNMNGQDADLYVVFDRTSARVLAVNYNPYDSRPFLVARYQYQPHIFFGLGVMEMCSPYQTEISDWHNFRMANARLVGSRAWGVKIGSPMSGQKLRIVPNKPLFFNDPTDMKEFRMADVYPSVLQYEMADMELVRERVGTMANIMAKPQPGHRTPTGTMQAMMSAVNRRFITSFDEMKAGLSEAVTQCVLRMQEQYKMRGPNQQRVADIVTKICGAEGAEKVLSVLRGSSADIRNNLTIEMQASSQQLNRQVDQQQSMMLMQTLGAYYDKTIALANMAGNQQVPPPVKKLAGDIAKKMTEAMSRFLQGFESVRDPKTFLLAEEDFDALVAQTSGGGPGQGGPDVAGAGGGPVPQNAGGGGNVGGDMQASGGSEGMQEFGHETA
jgi:hypothetical protein